MANFTNTEIKDTYQRVLQIDGGTIQNGLGQTVNGSINSLTGSFSGSFSGNGSGLTNLPASSAFPFSGSADITGSLDILGSPEPLKIINGSNNMYMQVNNISQLNASRALRLKAQGDAFGTGVILEADTSNIEIGADTSGKKIFMHSPTVEITSSLTVTGSAIITGSLNTSGYISASSFSGDGSGLTNLPASSTFPFTGDAVITGSLIINASSSTSQSLSVVGSGSIVFDVVGSVGTLFSVDDDLTGTLFTANDISGLPVLQVEAPGEVYLGKSPQSLYTTAVIGSNTANVTQSIYGLSTSSYAGAFFEYTAFSGSHDARAGSIMAIWSGSSVNFTETTTTDFGDTSNLLMQVAISQSQAQIQSYSTTAGYKIKTIVKAI